MSIESAVSWRLEKQPGQGHEQESTPSSNGPLEWAALAGLPRRRHQTPAASERAPPSAAAGRPAAASLPLHARGMKDSQGLSEAGPWRAVGSGGGVEAGGGGGEAAALEKAGKQERPATCPNATHPRPPPESEPCRRARCNTSSGGRRQARRRSARGRLGGGAAAWGLGRGRVNACMWTETGTAQALEHEKASGAPDAGAHLPRINHAQHRQLSLVRPAQARLRRDVRQAAGRVGGREGFVSRWCSGRALGPPMPATRGVSTSTGQHRQADRKGLVQCSRTGASTRGAPEREVSLRELLHLPLALPLHHQLHQADVAVLRRRSKAKNGKEGE